MTPLRIHLDALGCRLNQAEIERMAAAFRGSGHAMVAKPEDCDWVVLNSCCVTHRAVRDSRARVRALHRANPRARIAITGCWSTVDEAAARALPGVALLVPNECKDELPALLGGAAGPATRVREPIPGPKRRARAFLKVQDGCDHACAYCITTVARGPSRSVPAAEVLADLRAAERGGAREVVLTGVQLADWGKDLPGSPRIADLLDTLLGRPSQVRIRLSSLEPWGLPEGLFGRWADPRLCRQLHLPFQSGCDATLARMRRPYRRAEAKALVARARRAIPDLALSTDVLVGFPGETDAEFAQTLAWLDGLALADAHVFTFSPRPGTPAAKLPDAVSSAVARERRLAVAALVARSRRAFLEGLLGRSAEAIWVAAKVLDDGAWRLQGVTDRGVRVRAHASMDLWSRADHVRLDGVEPWGMRASILSPENP